KANNDLYQYLLHICVKVPETIKNELPKAMKNKLSVASSLDRKLQLYSWDSRMGGSDHYYENIAQYQAAGRVHAVDMRDSMTTDRGCNYEGITTIYTLSGKTVYL